MILLVSGWMIVSYLNPSKTTISNTETMFEGKLISYQEKEKEYALHLKIGNETVIGKLKKNPNTRIPIEIGMTYKIEGVLETPTKNTIFNTFNYQKYLFYQNIFYILKIDHMKVIKSNNGFQKGFMFLRNYISSGPNSEYKKMFLLGVKDNFDEETYANYQKNGISHLFVISGMHFTLMFALLEKVLKIFFKKKEIILIVATIGIVIYYVILPNSISLNRAFFFLLLRNFNDLGNIGLSNKRLFFYTLLFQLFLNPNSIFLISFQYSYGIVFGLIFFAKRKDKLGSMLEVSWLSFLFSLPITAFHNYEINFLSILINIIMIPYLTKVIMPLCAASLILPLLNPVLGILLNNLEAINQFLAQIDAFCLIMSKTTILIPVIYYFLLILYFLCSKKQLIVFLSAVILFWKVSPYFNSSTLFYFLDVGEGDSSLIVSAHLKEVILIDTGKKNEFYQKQFQTFLKSLGISKINSMILSHGDEDHTGNALDFLEKIRIQSILLNQGDINDIESEIIKKYPRKIINSYQSKMFLWQDLKHSIAKEENDNSRVIQVCVKPYCFLYMGDASLKVEEELITRYQLSPTFLKVGHHGSRTSTSAGFLEKIKPKIAIISSGRKNRYHHPHEEVMSRLEKQKIKVFNTQEKGSILFKIKSNTVTQNAEPP